MGTLFYGYDASRVAERDVKPSLPLEGGKMEGDLNMNLRRLYGVSAPMGPTGAISKLYLQYQLPKGLICMWSGTATPPTWALCNGSNGTPDLRDRFILSSGTKASGVVGGASSHTLTEAEVPPHKHSLPGYCNYIGTGAKSEDDGNKGAQVEINVGKSEGDELKLQTEDGVAGQPHLATPFSTMPPYYVLAFIIKL